MEFSVHKKSSAHRLLVYINNHTAVWGSWYSPSDGQWGYACCHSTIHASYCAGSAGIEAAIASSAQQLLSTATAGSSSSAAERVPKTLVDDHQERTDKANGRERAEQRFGKARLGDVDVALDEAKLAEAIRNEKKRKAAGEDEDEGRGRKKKNNSYEVTEEELGACSRPFV